MKKYYVSFNVEKRDIFGSECIRMHLSLPEVSLVKRILLTKENVKCVYTTFLDEAGNRITLDKSNFVDLIKDSIVLAHNVGEEFANGTFLVPMPSIGQYAGVIFESSDNNVSAYYVHDNCRNELRLYDVEQSAFIEKLRDRCVDTSFTDVSSALAAGLEKSKSVLAKDFRTYCYMDGDTFFMLIGYDSFENKYIALRVSCNDDGNESLPVCYVDENARNKSLPLLAFVRAQGYDVFPDLTKAEKDYPSIGDVAVADGVASILVDYDHERRKYVCWDTKSRQTRRLTDDERYDMSFEDPNNILYKHGHRIKDRRRYSMAYIQAKRTSVVLSIFVGVDDYSGASVYRAIEFTGKESMEYGRDAVYTEDIHLCRYSDWPDYKEEDRVWISVSLDNEVKGWDIPSSEAVLYVIGKIWKDRYRNRSIPHRALLELLNALKSEKKSEFVKRARKYLAIRQDESLLCPDFIELMRVKRTANAFKKYLADISQEDCIEGMLMAYDAEEVFEDVQAIDHTIFFDDLLAVEGSTADIAANIACALQQSYFELHRGEDRR